MRYSVGQLIDMIRKDDTRPFYNSWDWRKLSHAVIKENNNECYICKQKGKYTPAILTHHVNELKKRPDLAYSRTYTDEHGNIKKQLIPLCFNCHEEIHGRGFFHVSSHFSNEERW